MKRIGLAQISFLLCLLLAGCIAESAPASAPPDIEPEAQQEPVVTEFTPAPEVVPNSSDPEPDALADHFALTANEIDWFNEEFFNQDETARLRNQMLRSAYETAAEVDLFQLFYNGAQQAISPANVTDEERQQLAQIDSMATTLDITKVTVSEMDVALLELTGLTLEETGKIGLEQFIYLEIPDAYYFAHGDTNAIHCTVLSGRQNDDGTITLHYTYDHGTGCVTLRKTDDCYIFIANQFD